MKPLLFSGIEVEGRHKGKKTLFVQGIVSYNKIVTELNGSNYEQVYFGAKYKDFSIQPSDADINIIRSVQNSFRSPIYTLEKEFTYEMVLGLDLPEYIPIHLVIVIKYINDIFRIIEHLYTKVNGAIPHTQIKFFSSKYGVMLVPLQHFIFTNKDDYVEDDLVMVK